LDENVTKVEEYIQKHGIPEIDYKTIKKEKKLSEFKKGIEAFKRATKRLMMLRRIKNIENSKFSNLIAAAQSSRQESRTVSNNYDNLMEGESLIDKNIIQSKIDV
jgi:aspartate oxidase